MTRGRSPSVRAAVQARIAGVAHDGLGARGCLFTFHRAVPSDLWEGLPNRNFHLDLAFLDRLLTHLIQSGWAIVTIEEALRRSRAGRGGRYVNFSVDDCYRDTFEAVIPLFRRHGVPVTIFVTTGIPDGTMPMWTTGLEDTVLRRDRVLLEDGPLATATALDKRTAYARIAAAWDGPDSAVYYRSFCARNGIDAQAVHARHAISWDMLDALRTDAHVEIGAHTMTHPNIAALSPSAAMAEIAGGRERLRTRLGIVAAHFAFPFGRTGDCGPRDFDLARQAGFSSAATTRKGLVRQSQNPFCLPRNTLNGAHRHIGFAEAHLSGLSGLAAKVLGRV